MPNEHSGIPHLSGRPYYSKVSFDVPYAINSIAPVREGFNRSFSIELFSIEQCELLEQ
jgi:hypothetical protein